MFGGIHDLAHEKNDLHCYNFDKNEWIKIDSDFIETINIQEKLTLKGGYDNKVKALITQKTDNNSMPLKKPFLTPKNKHPFSIKLSKSPKNKKVSIVAEFALKKVKSPSKIKEERLKHDIHEKKNRLLAEFEISDEEKRKQLVQSPTTETMKKSINSMKFNFKFTSIQKNISIGIKESVIMTGYIIKDRKPCARDGCSASNFDNKLVIFGGDRHHMSLSDLYWLDLDKATKISLI